MFSFFSNATDKVKAVLFAERIAEEEAAREVEAAARRRTIIIVCVCVGVALVAAGIAANEAYLNQLELEHGDPIQWRRLGSTMADNINGCIDMYHITTLSGEKVCTLYISPYQNTISGTAPKGFRIKKEE